MNFFSSSVLTAISGVGVYVSPHIKSIFYPNHNLTTITRIALDSKEHQMYLKEKHEKERKHLKTKESITTEEIEEIDNLLTEEDFKRFYSKIKEKQKKSII